MKTKTKAEIEKSNALWLERKQERERLLEEQPILDSQGVRIEIGQLAWHENRLVEVGEIKPSFSAPGLRDSIERQPQYDYVGLGSFEVRSPEEAEREAVAPSNIAHIPADWFVGFHTTGWSARPKQLRIETDPALIQDYRLRRAKAELQGCDYLIELWQMRQLRAERRVRELLP
jgi:hypothetical protein